MKKTVLTVLEVTNEICRVWEREGADFIELTLFLVLAGTDRNIN